MNKKVKHGSNEWIRDYILEAYFCGQMKGACGVNLEHYLIGYILPLTQLLVSQSGGGYRKC